MFIQGRIPGRSQRHHSLQDGESGARVATKQLQKERPTCFAAIFFSVSPASPFSASRAAQPIPSAQLRTCIKRAAHRRGWRVVTDEPGKMRIKYVKGPHVLVADVTYDNEGYMIEAVKEGSTLFNKDGTAHRKVNSWTANLTVTIREEENKILLRQTN